MLADERHLTEKKRQKNLLSFLTNGKHHFLGSSNRKGKKKKRKLKQQN
jgi:hypothetical protein